MLPKKEGNVPSLRNIFELSSDVSKTHRHIVTVSISHRDLGNQLEICPLISYVIAPQVELMIPFSRVQI